MPCFILALIFKEDFPVLVELQPTDVIIPNEKETSCYLPFYFLNILFLFLTRRLSEQSFDFLFFLPSFSFSLFLKFFTAIALRHISMNTVLPDRQRTGRLSLGFWKSPLPIQVIYQYGWGFCFNTRGY